ncbi:DUF397 domain-containing protein [Streptomyces sp. NPDC021224]|uniref:DUF397 domain-containing protein n=1 Tax=unclassified Streptomyces TaxID=2593676 RepID=UPI0037890C2F
MILLHGPPGSAPAEDGWRKEWSGPNGGGCVESKPLPDGGVAVRQSTAPGGPALIFNRQEWAAFVSGVKGGQADFSLD